MLNQIYSHIAELLIYLYVGSLALSILVKNSRAFWVALTLVVVELICYKVDPFVINYRLRYNLFYAFMTALTIIGLMIIRIRSQSKESSDTWIGFFLFVVLFANLARHSDRLAEFNQMRPMYFYVVNSCNLMILFWLNKKNFKIILNKIMELYSHARVAFIRSV